MHNLSQSVTDRLTFVDRLADREGHVATSQKGKTAKSWVQYLNGESTQEFYSSRMEGDWELHLQCVGNMLPYFHTTGHHLYAKSVHLYLQDMKKLEESDYNLLVDNFTI